MSFTKLFYTVIFEIYGSHTDTMYELGWLLLGQSHMYITKRLNIGLYIEA